MAGEDGAPAATFASTFPTHRTPRRKRLFLFSAAKEKKKREKRKQKRSYEEAQQDTPSPSSSSSTSSSSSSPESNSPHSLVHNSLNPDRPHGGRSHRVPHAHKHQAQIKQWRRRGMFTNAAANSALSTSARLPITGRRRSRR